MDIYVLNKNLKRIGIVDNYNSVIWANRYAQRGDCEVYVPATSENLQLMQKGFYLERDDDGMVCQIKKIQLDTDAEDGNYLTVSGYDVKGFLDQRVIWGTATCNGNVEAFNRKLVSDALISPSIEARGLKKENGGQLLSLEAAQEFTEETSEQVSYRNIGEKIRETCQKYGWGYRIFRENSGLKFGFYKGTNRTSEVIFSDEFENLASTTYKSDDTKLGNVALVAGAGEGAERARSVYGYQEGVDRYELFVDAKDVAKNIRYADLKNAFPLVADGGSGYITTAGEKPVYAVGTLIIKVLDGNQLAWLKEKFPNGEVVYTTTSRNKLLFPSWAEVAACPKTSGYYNYPIQLEPNTTYYLSTNYDDGYGGWGKGYVLVSPAKNNSSWKAISHLGQGAVSGTVTTGSSGILYLNVNATQSQWEQVVLHSFAQIEKGTHATEYVSFWDGEVTTNYKIPNCAIADLQSDTPADGDSVTLRDVVYSAYLLERGYQKVVEYGETESFEGSVIPDITFTYKQDYFLGDIVKVRNEYGIEANARIVEVVEVQDVNGYRIEPKFEYLENGVAEYVEVPTGKAQAYEEGNGSPLANTVENLSDEVGTVADEVEAVKNGYLPLTGGTLSGNLNTPEAYAHGADGSTLSKLVAQGFFGDFSHTFSGLPTLDASTVGVSTSASMPDFLQAWLKYIVAHYKGIVGEAAYINNGSSSNTRSTMRPIVAIVNPAAVYVIIGAIYNPSAVSNDLPQYSGFTCFGVAGAAQYIYTFGTYNYSFQCRRASTSTF